MAPDSLPDPIAVAVSFAALLERLGISYLIGGSFASSIHGEPRSTNDIDVVADIRAEHVPSFVALLGPEYYVSAEAMEAAVRSEGTFNVIHVHGGMKVKVLVAGHDAFNQERLRFREAVLPLVGQSPTLYVDTAEHSVLRKLDGFRRGLAYRTCWSARSASAKARERRARDRTHGTQGAGYMNQPACACTTSPYERMNAISSSQRGPLRAAARFSSSSLSERGAVRHTST